MKCTYINNRFYPQAGLFCPLRFFSNISAKDGNFKIKFYSPKGNSFLYVQLPNFTKKCQTDQKVYQF